MTSANWMGYIAQISLLVLSTIAAAITIDDPIYSVPSPSTVPLTSTVPSPTNVTLQCHNFRVTLYWNYSQPSLQPQFQIKISKTKGPEEHKNVTAPNRRFDLSSLNDPSNDYTVTVMAVVQGRKSEPEPVDGLTFTHNIQHLYQVHDKHSTQPIICKLDLPPVNVTVQNGSILFRFFHPSTFYEEALKGKSRQKKHLEETPGSNPFSYLVQTKGQNKEKQFNCNTKVCTGTVEVLGDPVNYCVKIKKGVWKKGVWNLIAVEATKEYYCTLRKLDLPPVNVTLQKGGVMNFSFFHPSTVYAKMEALNLESSHKKHLGPQNQFVYSVQTKGQYKDAAHQFNCSNEVCTGTVEVLGDPESECVKIKGVWNHAAVETTQEYCCDLLRPPVPTGTRHHFVLIAVGVVLLLVFFLIWKWMDIHPAPGPSSETNEKDSMMEEAGDQRRGEDCQSCPSQVNTFTVAL